MAITGEQAFGISTSYTDESLIGMGALKGKNAQIKSIVYNDDGTKDITFSWKDNEDKEHEQTLVLKDGFSPKIEVIQNSSSAYQLKITTEKEEIITPNLKGSGGIGGGTNSYADLENKPKINGHELDGNLSSKDLGISSETKYAVTNENLVIENQN